MVLPGDKQHLSCGYSLDLFMVSVTLSPFVSSQDCPASSKLFGRHLSGVEDILLIHRGVGQHETVMGLLTGPVCSSLVSGSSS